MLFALIFVFFGYIFASAYFGTQFGLPGYMAILWPVMVPWKAGQTFGGHEDHSKSQALKMDSVASAIAAAREAEALRYQFEVLGLDTSDFGDVDPKARLYVLSKIVDQDVFNRLLSQN